MLLFTSDVCVACQITVVCVACQITVGVLLVRSLWVCCLSDHCSLCCLSDHRGSVAFYQRCVCCLSDHRGSVWTRGGGAGQADQPERAEEPHLQQVPAVRHQPGRAAAGAHPLHRQARRHRRSPLRRHSQNQNWVRVIRRSI